MVHLNITGTVLGSDVNKTSKTTNPLSSWSLQSGRHRQPYRQIITGRSHWYHHEEYIQGRGKDMKDSVQFHPREVRKVFTKEVTLTWYLSSGPCKGKTRHAGDLLVEGAEEAEEPSDHGVA